MPSRHEAPAIDQYTSAADVAALTRRLGSEPRLVLLLDFDGTVVPLRAVPRLARPDADLLEILGGLAASPARSVHVVSGRHQVTLAEWFGHLPIGLWAEHGLWYRGGPDAEWELTVDAPSEWFDQVRPILQHFTATTPGSLIEEKSRSLAWHYRVADAEFGARQARELRLLLTEALMNQPAEVIEGRRVIEIRPRGANKALVVQRILPKEPPHAVLVAVGDDRTDEEMFAAMPPSGVSVHVGGGQSRATYRLPDPSAVRSFLRALGA